MRLTIITVLASVLVFSACDTGGSSQEATPTANRSTGKPGKRSASSRESHLGQSQIRPLFSAMLGGYKLAGTKVAVKSPEWAEYKGTYQSGSKEIKVVINDWIPEGKPDWDTKVPADGEKTQGFPSAFEEKSDKRTLMVRVGKRYRVDFKSTNMTAVEIRKVAGFFLFTKVQALPGGE